MLTPEDRQVARHVLLDMIEMRQSKAFSQERFDFEMKNYLQFLLSEKVMDIVEIRELTASVGMDIHINVHTISHNDSSGRE